MRQPPPPPPPPADHRSSTTPRNANMPRQASAPQPKDGASTARQPAGRSQAAQQQGGQLDTKPQSQAISMKPEVEMPCHEQACLQGQLALLWQVAGTQGCLASSVESIHLGAMFRATHTLGACKERHVLGHLGAEEACRVSGRLLSCTKSTDGVDGLVCRLGWEWGARWPEAG